MSCPGPDLKALSELEAVRHVAAITQHKLRAWLPQAGAEDTKGAAPMSGRKPQRFIPFSQGNRDCVGQTLARLNLATTLAQLFGNFSFKLAAEVGCAVHLCMHGLERGRNGLLMCAHKRATFSHLLLLCTHAHVSSQHTALDAKTHALACAMTA